MKFFAPEKLSARRRKTPEGYLVLEGTPLARTGIQLYAPEELGLDVAPELDGMIHVHRKAEDVFNPDSIASWNGKPITNDHPLQMLNPQNWRPASYGVVLNPRRGTGGEEDLLLGDILVYDQEMIDLIDDGKIELSGGYNPEYEEFEPGKVKQTNIIGNHVALVDEGRCGSRCAIRDQTPSKEIKIMGKPLTLRQKLMTKLGITDAKKLEEALDAALDEGPAEGASGVAPLHVHMHTGGGEALGADRKDEDVDDPMAAMGQRIGALEDSMKGMSGWGDTLKKMHDKMFGAEEKEEKESKDENKEEEEKESKDKEPDESEKEMEEEGMDKGAKDSVSLAASFQTTVSVAEIVAPGIAAPTFDRSAKPGATFKAICDHRKQALDFAWLNPARRSIIAEVTGKNTFDLKKMSCGRVRATFLAVGAAVKRMNNAGSGGANDRQAPPGHGGITSISDLVKRGEDLYKPKMPGR